MTPEKKTLLLVDGSSYLYRAFHAMPDLRANPADPSSPATGAIRGMVNMLQKLRKDHRADYAACVFDAKGPTFRDRCSRSRRQWCRAAGGGTRSGSCHDSPS